jgi:hypothetical protein
MVHSSRGRKAWFGAAASAFACALVATTLATATAGPDETNLDLMTRLTGEVVEELYAGFAPRLDGRPVSLKPFGTGEDYTFVFNVLTSSLVRAGVPVAMEARPAAGSGPGGAPADSVPRSTGLVLKFQDIAFDLAYPDVFRSHLIGGKRVRREAAVRILATLTDGASGDVLWTGEAARTSADVFDADNAARVEQGSYTFAQPATPSGGWGRYAEPVFVTGIIVGLIYLFFSNQSGN